MQHKINAKKIQNFHTTLFCLIRLLKISQPDQILKIWPNINIFLEPLLCWSENFQRLLYIYTRKEAIHVMFNQQTYLLNKFDYKLPEINSSKLILWFIQSPLIGIDIIVSGKYSGHFQVFIIFGLLRISYKTDCIYFIVFFFVGRSICDAIS